MLADVAAFAAVAVIVIVTPGPDTALTIRNTLLGGRRSGMLTAVGVASGQAVWTIATALGVAALLAASEPVFTAVKVLGAAYLVWLGAQTLLGAISRAAPARTLPVTGRRDAPMPAALRTGLVSNLTNPKMAAFFPALLPQFAPPSAPTFAAVLALGLMFSVMTLAWLSAYAVGVARAGDLLRRPRARRALEAATGAVLVALGLRLATQR